MTLVEYREAVSEWIRSGERKRFIAGKFMGVEILRLRRPLDMQYALWAALNGIGEPDAVKKPGKKKAKKQDDDERGTET